MKLTASKKQLKENPNIKAFSEDLSSKLVSVVSRFGCRQYPSPSKLKQIQLLLLNSR